MESAKFEEANLALAEDQPEYQTLHGYLERKTLVDAQGKTHNAPWSFTACFQLTDEEVEEIVRTRKIWYRQMLFGHAFHPIRMATRKDEVLPTEATAKIN